MSLVEVLEGARALGYLGPGPVTPHIAHSAGMALAVESIGAMPSQALDLGSGGGVPGLVLAERWPDSEWVLLESRSGKATFLRTAVADLGLENRVVVRHGRAEDAGRDASVRGAFDLVVSRSFGPPAVTAECGSPFLRVGGYLAVSEPPGGNSKRWPVAGVAQLGLDLVDSDPGDVAVQLLRQAGPCPSRYPRRPGVPNRRPLF